MRQGEVRARNVIVGNWFAENDDRILRAPACEILGVLAHHDHVFPRLRLAQISKGRHRQRNKAQRFTRRVESPPRENHQTVVGEMVEIIAERVRRVKVVFRKSECPGGGGGPGIHQRGLQHLIFVLAAPYEAPPVLDKDMHLRPEIQIAAELPVFLAHHRVGDDRIDLNRSDVLAARTKRARNVPSPTETRTLIQQVEFLVRREVIDVKIRDTGGSIRVYDQSGPEILIVHQADSRKTVPLNEQLLGKRSSLGIADIDRMLLAVINNENDKCQRQGDGAHASTLRPSQVVPDGRRHGEQHRPSQNRVRSAKLIQQRHQRQAAGRSSEQIEEINAIDSLYAFRDR